MNERQPSLSLVVPMYNCARFARGTMSQAVEFLESLDVESELVVVDDGSSDGTADELRSFRDARTGTEGPEIVVLENERNAGKGYSVRRGFLHSRGEFVVFTDADLTYPLRNVLELVDALRAGADVAYGSRMHEDSRYVVAPTFFGKLFSRHFSGRVFNRILRMTVLPGILDSQAGLKGFRRDAARRLATLVSLNRFSFDVELLFAARRMGLRLESCPVEFIYRKEPSTVHFVRDSLAMLRDIVRVRIRGIRGHYETTQPAPSIEDQRPSPTSKLRGSDDLARRQSR